MPSSGERGRSSTPSTGEQRRFDISWLGYLGLLGFLDRYDPGAAIFYTFFLLFLIPVAARCLPSASGDTERRESAKAYARVYLWAWLSSFINPYLFVHGVMALVGQFVTLLRCRFAVPDPRTYSQAVILTLPFEGTWMVGNGGLDRKTSHSWDVINQRYAYDFLKVDAQGSNHRGDGKHLADYYAFGCPVVAPADGQVVAAASGVRDYQRPGSGLVDFWTRDFRGNHLVLRHGPQEYSLLGHLKRGSLVVQRGDAVRRGDVVGLCGNSGHSTEPHVHFQFMDRGEFFLAASLPPRFLHADPCPGEGRYLTRGELVQTFALAATTIPSLSDGAPDL